LVPTTPLFALHWPIHSSGGKGKNRDSNESKKLQLTLSLSLVPKTKRAVSEEERGMEGEQEATTHAELILHSHPTKRGVRKESNGENPVSSSLLQMRKQTGVSFSTRGEKCAGNAVGMLVPSCALYFSQHQPGNCGSGWFLSIAAYLPLLSACVRETMTQKEEL
jgi:hypothetical protein